MTSARLCPEEWYCFLDELSFLVSHYDLSVLDFYSGSCSTSGSFCPARSCPISGSFSCSYINISRFLSCPFTTSHLRAPPPPSPPLPHPPSTFPSFSSSSLCLYPLPPPVCPLSPPPPSPSFSQIYHTICPDAASVQDPKMKSILNEWQVEKPRQKRTYSPFFVTVTVMKDCLTDTYHFGHASACASQHLIWTRHSKIDATSDNENKVFKI